MPRAALYARFSSDLQRDQSIEDQLHLCREHAKRQGWEIVEEYSDRARSGANLIGRPGVLRLLGDAAAGKFDIILAESPDRLSRDLADLATIRKTLAHQGVAIHSVNGGAGPLDVMEAGLRGIMGEMFLTDLKAKTRRGMLGVIREGRSAGGRQYGYRPVPGKAGQLEVVEAEAEIVRRIWREYAAGKSPRAIVADLNAERHVAPRGGEWRVNTVIGNKGRGGGILKNPLFEGRIVWGRVRMIVDPKTGRRLSRPNPESEWQSADAPHLRIIDPDLVEKVRARQAAGAQDAAIRNRPRSRRVLSGLLRCGVCGGPMAHNGTTRGGTRIRCTRATESGTCKSTARLPLAPIEATVLAGLQQLFAHQDRVQEAIDFFYGDQQKSIEEARRNRDKLERRFAETGRAIDRVVDLLAEGVLAKDEARPKLERLRAERAAVEEELAIAERDVATIEAHPERIYRWYMALKAFRDLVDKTGEASAEKAAHIRELIGSVTVTPTGPYKAPLIEVTGRVGALISDRNADGSTRLVADPRQPLSKQMKAELDRMMTKPNISGAPHENAAVRLVAGGRVELPTSGL
jgi:site-specific DNA recombinase